MRLLRRLVETKERLHGDRLRVAIDRRRRLPAHGTSRSGSTTGPASPRWIARSQRPSGTSSSKKPSRSTTASATTTPSRHGRCGQDRGKARLGRVDRHLTSNRAAIGRGAALDLEIDEHRHARHARLEGDLPHRTAATKPDRRGGVQVVVDAGGDRGDRPIPPGPHAGRSGPRQERRKRLRPRDRLDRNAARKLRRLERDRLADETDASHERRLGRRVDARPHLAAQRSLNEQLQAAPAESRSPVGIRTSRS